MILVEWDKQWELGVTQIDEHHQQLVRILNKCYSALMLQDHHKELSAVIKELREYTEYHFGTEKRLMELLSYHDAASHLAQHEKFIQSINEFQEKFESGESLVAMELLVFLKEWLVNHIQKTDSVFSVFLKQHGVA